MFHTLNDSAKMKFLGHNPFSLVMTWMEHLYKKNQEFLAMKEKGKKKGRKNKEKAKELEREKKIAEHPHVGNFLVRGDFCWFFSFWFHCFFGF